MNDPEYLVPLNKEAALQKRMDDGLRRCTKFCVISHRANSIKNNGTVEEHRKIADWMEKRIALMETTYA